jgi:hypothetical protein
MKKLSGLLAALMVFAGATWAQVSSQVQHRYDIKSGIITLETVMTVGQTQLKTTKVVYFDDFGTKEREETFSDGKLGMIIFSDGKDRYSLKQAKKIAVKKGPGDHGVGVRVDISDMATKKDIKAGMVKKIAPMTIAGQTCEVIAVTRGAQVDFYGGWNHALVYLKTASDVSTTEIKAIKLEANAKIPAEKFQVPQGYVVQ